MFYSQFILAKKGPLGTIWIAAHLERKLRKNQVADTDIGVSVDSIIFPEVPIALRLSSHLLLGVVRIYSRKVNYLFDDCSEALLKIKQAFRSTAVDLPPEESTAPYHSITLPETFDLDDFELPDQEIFQGNYVDHHISNKEQITLQDTLDGVVYSTSQFGLDERFGDGDLSQIGLDLDEELLLNKLPAPENVGDGMNVDHPDESIQNENNRDMLEASEAMEAKSTGPEVDNGNNILLEYAHAPATPGLVEEPNLSNQKTSACDDHFESENHHKTEIVTHKDSAVTLHSSPHGEDMLTNHNHATIFSKENGHLSTSPNSKQSEPQDRHCGESDMNDHVPSLNVIGKTCDLRNLSDQPCFNPGDLPELPPSPLSNGCQLEEQETVQRETLNKNDVACHAEEPLSPNNVLKKSCGLGSQNGADSLQVLRPCNSDVKMHDSLSNGKEDLVIDTSKVQDSQATVISPGKFQATDSTKSDDCLNQTDETCQHVEAKYSGLNDKTRTAVTKQGDEVSLPPSMSELPAFEKLLSMPEEHAELPTDLVNDITPDKILSAVDEDGSGLITGHKRSFTESTITVDSLNTAESSGKDRLKKTSQSIPDDEDLLSSILVGRRPSILKLKPTPTLTEALSMKRPRIALRSVTYKRKVLMDDTMVLHGDTIREQLVSTEDIRRVRKKAPCTHQETWMIQKQFLEEDIVYDPISTGMAMELVCLHNQAYELSGISIARGDISMNQMVLAHDMQSPQEKIIPDSQDRAVEEISKETQLVTIFHTESQPGAGVTSSAGHDNNDVRKGTSTASLPLATSLEQGTLSEMEVDGECGAAAVVESAAQASLQPTADISETAVNCSIDLPDETNDCNHKTNEASLLHKSNIGEIDHSHVAATKNGVGSSFHDESGTPNEFSLKEASNGVSVEDIETLRPLLASESYNHDLGFGTSTRNNDVINETGPSFSDGVQNAMLNEFDEMQSQANGTTYGDSAVTKDNYGEAYITAEHDTGFLNVDDDQLEEDESHMPSVDESRTLIVDNSGWSSRSRAVGKYLQIMFDKEAGRGKNVISMDSLLTGKKRKEASRMFFETLVLKTKDYIQVDQTSPFDNINLCPQSMLMKSDF